MKFLLDECVLGKTKKLLEEAGFSVVTVGDLGKTSAVNGEVMNLAESQEAILITADLDFSDLTLYPLGSHGGIIVLRLRPDKPEVIDQVNQVLIAFLKEIDPSSVKKSLVIIDRNKYRIRHL